MSPRAEPSAVAAFDLDGTITWADAFTTFLRARTPRPKFWAAVLPLAPMFFAFLFAKDGRRRAKEAFATRLLAGVEEAALAAEAEAFWAGEGARILRLDALAEIERRRAEGLAVVIVTACPEIVAAPLARRLNADLIGTRLCVEDGRLTGRIDGANCRGAEKVARLRATLGPDVRVAAAFGDSAGDRELLAVAEEGFMAPFRDGPRWPLLVTIAMWL
jgi:phosphatidylglycerophosphatase C